MPSEMVKISDLKQGDIIDLGWKDGYSYATVYRINKDGSVHVFRPYVHADNILISNNQIITYIGHEDFALYSGNGSCPSMIKRVRKGPDLK